MTFDEFITGRQKAGLPDAQSMLSRAGIWPSVPHEVELLRLLKSWKKGRPCRAKQPLGMADPAPRID